MKPTLVVHCGADDEENPFLQEKEKVFKQVLAVGKEMLQKTDDSLDAVVTAIKILEDSGYTDAGCGSFIQLDGTVRMDASLMGSDLRAGAVVQIEWTQNPIAAARILFESDLHVILSGKQATQFADKMGLPRFTKTSQFANDMYKTYRAKIKDPYDYQEVSHAFLNDLIEKKTGTVGAVAINSEGYIVAGTSTGGLRSGYPGRVGDSAIIGAGTYANERAGISVTGVGEKVIKLTLAKTVYNSITRGMAPQAACELGVQELAQAHAVGGIVAVDREGRYGAAFNTKTMIWGAATV
jgi:L-asparaginase / beta-aspartyl-peptidase